MNMPTSEGLKEFLEGLGDDRSKVYESLRKLGVKGRPGSACHCPIAEALRKKYGSHYVVGVSPESAGMRDPVRDPAGGVSCRMPFGAQDFIFDFDAYHSIRYPEVCQ